MNSDNIVELKLNQESPSPDRQARSYRANSRNNGGNGGGDNMLQRIKDLEKTMQQVKTDLAVVRSNYATTSSVSDAKTTIILWTVGAVALSQLIPAIPKILNTLLPM